MYAFLFNAENSRVGSSEGKAESAQYLPCLLRSSWLSTGPGLGLSWVLSQVHALCPLPSAVTLIALHPAAFRSRPPPQLHPSRRSMLCAEMVSAGSPDRVFTSAAIWGAVETGRDASGMCRGVVPLGSLFLVLCLGAFQLSLLDGSCCGRRGRF